MGGDEEGTAKRNENEGVEGAFVILRINVDSEAPVYRQIADAVRRMLVEGELRAGDVLPPVRQLAADLGVHFNTVAEAYRILAEEGWLDLRRRRGAVVLERKAPRANRAAVNHFSERLRQFIAEVQAGGIPAAAIARELRLIAEGLER
jgi:DNA-binding transcriptional regulator YhcF (GntR family)